MDFRHQIVTSLFSMLRLSFETQKIKENYAIFQTKREDFCGTKNRISSIYYLPHSFLHLFIRLFYMLFQKQKEDSTLILNHISKAPYFRSDRGVIEE